MDEALLAIQNKIAEKRRNKVFRRKQNAVASWRKLSDKEQQTHFRDHPEDVAPAFDRMGKVLKSAAEQAWPKLQRRMLGENEEEK
ncbi:MAG: hypothetical protein JWO50_180 [Candidatus Kaiserbacteria bacterium]|nr:hypothetical protein [Candidatus Kaiserbacteria bacterium]